MSALTFVNALQKKSLQLQLDGLLVICPFQRNLCYLKSQFLSKRQWKKLVESNVCETDVSLIYILTKGSSPNFATNIKRI